MKIIDQARILGDWLVARLDVRSERGASAVEYGILAALIAAVVIVAVIFLGNKTSSALSCTASNVDAGPGATGC